ncbi:ABC transporter ATP-binding protein [candidate division KSB1 bacterium]|nr:ABC transporter ATP-binding protein [candidate division KSB1 bacterium]
MLPIEEQDYIKQFDFGLWRRLLKFAHPYRPYLFKLGFVMITVGGIDAIMPIFSKMAIDRFITPQTTQYLGWFIFAFILTVCLLGICVWLLISLAGRVDMWVCYDIRKAGFQRLQELSLSFYDRTLVGWLMTRLTSDVQKLGDVVSWSIVQTLWGFAMMVIMVILMLYLNWKLALITFSVIPFLVIVSLFFQKRILRAHRLARKINSRITGAFNEGIMGARTSKTLVREAENLAEFKLETAEMYHASVRAAIYSSVYLPIVLVLGNTGAGLALWFGGEGVFTKSISYGTLVAFVSYAIQFFEPIRQLAAKFAELQSAQAAAERTFSLFETEVEIKDSPEIIQKYGESFATDRKNWPPLIGDIHFQNVTFAYQKGEKILENFNLKVNAGEKIALVGETGSGKSTIVNLACRFYEPTAGEILIDGVNYQNYPLLWLHSHLGYVLQNPHLFSGTIRDNIRYGRLEATDDEVIQAAKLVNAHDFIMKLEKGYDSEVGEGGSRISTGQKQLISFARAILANPKIFVLDEATSSVDTETEQIIQAAIQTVLAGRTSFIIAHRLSTIRSADRILVIQKGKIIEDGTHQQLLKKQGHYYRLYTNQFIDEHEMELLQTRTGLAA